MQVTLFPRFLGWVALALGCPCLGCPLGWVPLLGWVALRVGYHSGLGCPLSWVAPWVVCKKYKKRVPRGRFEPTTSSTSAMSVTPSPHCCCCSKYFLAQYNKNLIRVALQVALFGLPSGLGCPLGWVPFLSWVPLLG